MYSAKGIGSIIVILLLVAGNAVLYAKNSALHGEIDTLLAELSRPSGNEAQLERKISELSAKLSTEQANTERVSQRAQSLGQLSAKQQLDIATLEFQVKAMGAEVMRTRNDRRTSTRASTTEPTASQSTASESAPWQSAPSQSTASQSTASQSAASQSAASQSAASEATASEATASVSSPSLITSPEVSQNLTRVRGKVEYIVKPGDLLQDIAGEYYGDGREWRRILEANKDIVKDARSLQPGMVLVIPEADK